MATTDKPPNIDDANLNRAELAYAEAELRIAEAKSDGLTDLNLGILELKEIPPFPERLELRSLYFGGAQISDLTALTSLATLKKLHLGRTLVTNLTPLATLTALEVLYLTQTQVSEIAPLASLTSLKHLDLQETFVSRITPLSSLTAINKLNLNYTLVSDIAPLASLISLERLSLWNTQISDITPLSSLTLLKELDISETEVMELAPLATLASLEELNLNNTLVSDLTPLASLASLIDGANTSPSQGLYFEGCPLRDKILLGFAKFDNPERTTRTINYLRQQQGQEPYDPKHKTEPTPTVLLQHIKPDPLGAVSRVSGDEFVLDLATHDTETVDVGEVFQFQQESLRKITVLQNRVNSLHNIRTWEDLPVTANLLYKHLGADPSRYAEYSLTLWSLSVSLATFLEQSRAIKTSGSSNSSALEPETERAITDVLMTVAPFLRNYQTSREFDNGLADFEARPPALEAARELTAHSDERHVLQRTDAKIVSLALANEAAHGPQSKKAHGFGYKTLVNHVGAIFLFLWGGGVKKLGEKVASRVVNETDLADRAADLLIEREKDVRELYEASPPDLREAAAGLLELTKEKFAKKRS